MFWLSHHRADEYDRTYSVAGVHLCARCLGTYPVLLAAIAIQFKLHAALSWSWDLPWAVGLLLPALGDWSYGRFRPHAGSNAWRTLTGAMLGLALGRSLFVHLQRPLPATLLAQAVLVTGVAVPVILVAARRRPG